jgi:hypothetical protein
VNVYYFEKPLSEDDLEFVAEALELESAPTQIQIPHVLPVIDPGPIDAATQERHMMLLRNLIRRAGIAKDGGQPTFVAPSQMYWHTRLTSAIFEETGYFPHIVQTEEQRSAIDNPGPTRVLDAHGISGLKP